MKKIISFLLCAAMLLGFAPMGVSAAESSPKFYTVRMAANELIHDEKAIISDGEIYIEAAAFAKYTRYGFNRATNTFLVEGQLQNKAFKAVTVEPKSKRLLVKQHMMDLKDCFAVGDELYLPLSQMLPVLDADIAAAYPNGILITNNPLSMAELFYDFDIKDYAFDYAKEFRENKKLAFMYIMPGYLFDSVTNFRFDRLDFIFKSGSYNDYKDIMLSYLKDDALFRKTMEQPEPIEPVMKFINSKIIGDDMPQKHLNDIYDWVDAVYKTDQYDNKTLINNPILDFIYESSGSSDTKAELITDAMFSKDLLEIMSVADILKLVNYAYTYTMQVDDHLEMLDAVYDVASVTTSDSPQEQAALQTYFLYEKEVGGGMVGVTVEALAEIVKDSLSNPEFDLYKACAKLSGLAWEVVIPGNTDDVSKLMYHAGIASEAMVKATAMPKTEQSTEKFRLATLLTMIASRKCYTIMAETAEAWEMDSARYRKKIADIEAMIMGLYLVADNVAYDTYEHYDDHARDALKRIEESGILDNLQEYTPVPDSMYTQFMKGQKDYAYYSVLDVDGDGVDELLLTEEARGTDGTYNYLQTGAFSLFVWNGARFEKEAEVSVKDYLSFCRDQNWLVAFSHGTSGAGTQDIIYKNDLSRFCVVSHTWIPDETDGWEISRTGSWETDYTCVDPTPIKLPEREWYFSKLDDFDPYAHEVPFLPIDRQESVPIWDELPAGDTGGSSVGGERSLPADIPSEYRTYLKNHSDFNSYLLLDLNGDANEELLVTADPKESVLIVDWNGTEYVEYWVIAGDTLRYFPEYSWIVTRGESPDGSESYSITYKDESGEYVTAYITWLPREAKDNQWSMALYSYSEVPAPELDWFVDQLQWIEPYEIEFAFQTLS